MAVLLGALFGERRVCVRTGAGSRFLVVSRRSQIAAAVGLCLLVGVLTFGSVGLVAGHRLLLAERQELARREAARTDVIEGLRREIAAGERRVATVRAELARALAAAQDGAERSEAVVADLRRRLAVLEAELDAVADERDGAIALARALGGSLDEAEAWLRAVVDDKLRLAGELEFADARVAAVAEERDSARRESLGLAWRAEFLEAQLERARDARGETLARLRAWIGDQVEALEGLFASTGLNPDALLARALEPEAGQGGPLELAPQAGVEIHTGLGALSLRIDDAFGRLVMLQRLLAVLPLGAPLDQYRVASLFGERIDPIARRAAFHGGIDLAATRGAWVLATAPGIVVHAGWAGAYGNMVEIDHGFGVVTRYGHLREVSVAPGDQVTDRQEIGVIGSTGRSTGRHLHYEVRLDGEPRDPAKFLNAGRRLIHVFDG
ncbi:MAG TPA: peptidoglycan DD-metalloendopeptidase family protein [Geminicoccaceae bacterium]|nr:peptidoglycan DD-metalloendopeptidase family protein [Geminicoccaceae bacterium]